MVTRGLEESLASVARSEDRTIAPSNGSARLSKLLSGRRPMEKQDSPQLQRVQTYQIEEIAARFRSLTSKKMRASALAFMRDTLSESTCVVPLSVDEEREVTQYMRDENLLAQFRSLLDEFTEGTPVMSPDDKAMSNFCAEFAVLSPPEQGIVFHLAMLDWRNQKE